MTWKCYMIDNNAIWANEAMYEVAPDLVLFIYAGANSPKDMRVQLLRVTPEGIYPVTPDTLPQ